MTEPPYAHVKSNPRFELGWNRLQTAIQIFVAVVVIAGLFGLFGTGLFSTMTVVGPSGGFRLRYDRILRRTVQTDVQIDFTKALPDKLAVELPSSFAREMDIVSTSPRSDTMRVTTDGVAYVFDTGGVEHGEITLSMKPKRFGLFASLIRVGGAEVSVRQLVWP